MGNDAASCGCFASVCWNKLHICPNVRPHKLQVSSDGINVCLCATGVGIDGNASAFFKTSSQGGRAQLAQCLSGADRVSPRGVIPGN